MGLTKDNKIVFFMALRYIFLILITVGGFKLFYLFFTPLTVYPVYWLLGLFFSVNLLSKTIILINGTLPIEFIPACISGAAYYLLLALNISTPNIKPVSRIKMILVAFSTFLIVNIIRIFVLSIMAFYNSTYFNAAHNLFWYGLSTFFIVVIWFAEVKYFKIKKIPFYSDLKFLYKKAKPSAK